MTAIDTRQFMTFGVVIATFKTAGATRRAAEATERSADVEADEAKATLAEAQAIGELVTMTREQMRHAAMPVVTSAWPGSAPTQLG